MDEETTHLETLIATHTSNLRKLRETAAQYGIAVPLFIQNDIDHQEKQIRILRQSLIARQELQKIKTAYNEGKINADTEVEAAILGLIEMNKKALDLIVVVADYSSEVFKGATKTTELSIENIYLHLITLICTGYLAYSVFNLEIALILCVILLEIFIANDRSRIKRRSNAKKE